ncbi:MAG: DUF5644 domain-containing protein [Halarcobacter sp.]
MKLEISLFRFDYKSDYLPYYTKNFIQVKNEKKLVDLLDKINIEEPFEYRSTDNFNLVVNGIFTKASISIDELVKTFGKDLIIEPISIRRSKKDLTIDDSDFKQRLKLLEEFVDDEIKALYNSYKIYFYASNTINYEYEYIGDALLLLAYDLIQKNKKDEKRILEILSQHECGAQFHTSLENRVYNLDMEIENKIQEIKKKLNLTKDIKEQNFTTNKKNKALAFENIENIGEIKHYFDNFNIAYYKGLNEDTQTSSILNKLNAKVIDTEAMKSDLALESFHINKEFSMKLASTVMIEAFDNSADLLVVDDEKLFSLFDANRETLKELSGREIDLPVIHKSELIKLAIGQHDEVKKTLIKHSVNPELI